jgi:hypothetical protein
MSSISRDFVWNWSPIASKHTKWGLWMEKDSLWPFRYEIVHFVRADLWIVNDGWLEASITWSNFERSSMGKFLRDAQTAYSGQLPRKQLKTGACLVWRIGRTRNSLNLRLIRSFISPLCEAHSCWIMLPSSPELGKSNCHVTSLAFWKFQAELIQQWPFSVLTELDAFGKCLDYGSIVTPSGAETKICGG